AECPMEAIQILGQEDTRYSQEIAAAAGRVGDLGLAGERQLLVLACANSASVALHAARLQGAALPPGLRLVQVPCAGKVDADMVLEGLQRGFDGVLILSCHPDACYSLTGSTWAGMRKDHLAGLLAETGLEPERLMLAGVAPSQSKEVLAVIKKALATLDRLGPSPLKVGAQVREVLTRYTLDMDDTYSIVS
ncbi:MAG: hydrogenase iron-sulfur subunit, partial [Desulfarculaceae bacterium]|nr:hydrogenase iron-sulfur subunit [Desulfarculaceae bacterium]